MELFDSFDNIGEQAIFKATSFLSAGIFYRNNLDKDCVHAKRSNRLRKAETISNNEVK